ncbi:hypothetical protein [Mycolicibacterium komossense]|uniref:hypothetical protein n=1 Tax=Mycolicibacterium komossense TaxID=1779 RepID=UPI0021F2E784|nr:hypothetical protein [Mycolicibacterium komossense]
MTAIAPADTDPPKVPSFSERYYGTHPFIRVALRWLLILGSTTVAFWPSLVSLAYTTRHGGVGGYVWVVPIAAMLVAIGVARRNRDELPIHDRQTDIIVGIMGLVLALLVKGVLLARFDLYFHLLRLDLVAMWLFVLSSSIVLFGLRPVTRFGWVWYLLLMVFPLPYYLMVIVFGGGNFAAGAATMAIASTATAIAVGRTHRRGLLGLLASLAVGLAVLAVMYTFFPDAPLLVYQQVPAYTSIIVVGLAMYLRARRGTPKRMLDRKVEPLAAKQVWSAVPLVIAVAVALAVVHLPPQADSTVISRAAPGELTFGQPVVAPAGWQTTGRINYRQVDRFYGTDAVLVRQAMTADVGDPRFDKFSRPRTVMVDNIVSNRPFSFEVYPGRMVYGLTDSRFSVTRTVDLGYGVKGQLLSVVDDNLLITWNSLRFAWGSSSLSQRITVFAVDNHDQNAPFPTPTGTLMSTLRTMFTLLFRGNAVLDENAPSYKDADLLTEFGRELVAAQFGALGSSQ